MNDQPTEAPRQAHEIDQTAPPAPVAEGGAVWSEGEAVMLHSSQSRYWPGDWSIGDLPVWISPADEAGFLMTGKIEADNGWRLEIVRESQFAPTDDQYHWTVGRLREIAAFLNGRIATPNGDLMEECRRLKARIKELEADMLRNVAFDDMESWQRFIPPAVRSVWEALPDDARRALFDQAVKLAKLAEEDEPNLAGAFPVTF